MCCVYSVAVSRPWSMACHIATKGLSGVGIGWGQSNSAYFRSKKPVNTGKEWWEQTTRPLDRARPQQRLVCLCDQGQPSTLGQPLPLKREYGQPGRGKSSTRVEARQVGPGSLWPRHKRTRVPQAGSVPGTKPSSAEEAMVLSLTIWAQPCEFRQSLIML